MTKSDHIRIFDTTLRDGEQSPGASMTHGEKLELAALMEDMGVDVIEAGFPAASEGDFASVSEIARRSKDAIICGLSRSTEKDIARCGEAVRHAARPHHSCGPPASLPPKKRAFATLRALKTAPGTQQLC